ncbi:MAG: ferrous iron transport protein B [Ottowia sp.]|nr:ferrous iron transport protein B [Ottowia sp.]
MKRVALVGMPNTGKSTLFNRLTGANAKVGNWPGITVDLLAAKILLGGEMVELVDLPGIYDLHGYSEDESVVTQFLQHQHVDLVLLVVNAGQIERQLPLLMQVAQMGCPTLLVLNMQDEARKLGITIDQSMLADQLGMPVCLLSAKYGQGLEQLRAHLPRALAVQTEVRALAANGSTGLDSVRGPLNADDMPASTFKNKLSEVVLEQALRRAVFVPAQASHALTEKLDKVLLHPWFGLPLFFIAMAVMFTGVFVLGKPIQDGMTWIFDLLRAHLLEPALIHAPPFLHGLLLDGLYSGLSTVASFVPLIVLFFLGMAIVEDTGYLSRAAFLMDALMAKFGLDGRSFVMILMGFGCNVPALMGTRVMRSRGLRLLTMLIIPLSLCSARLQVFLFFIAALFPIHIAPLVLFSLYLVSILSAVLTASLFKSRFVNDEPFVLEVPPYRFPTLRQMGLRGWHEVRHFLKRATRFIVAGVVLVWLLTNFPSGATPASSETWAGQLGDWLSPIFLPLGINAKLTIALIFGFVAKEIVIGALAVIYVYEGGALAAGIARDIDWVQAYSFMLFTLIYTPCLSTIATIRNEAKNISFTITAVVWPLLLAWLCSYIFYQGMRLLQL